MSVTEESERRRLLLHSMAAVFFRFTSQGSISVVDCAAAAAAVAACAHGELTVSVLYIPAVILGFKDEISLSSVAVVQIIFFFFYATGIFYSTKIFHV